MSFALHSNARVLFGVALSSRHEVPYSRQESICAHLRANTKFGPKTFRYRHRHGIILHTGRFISRGTIPACGLIHSPTILPTGNSILRRIEKQRKGKSYSLDSVALLPRFGKNISRRNKVE